MALVAALPLVLAGSAGAGQKKPDAPLPKNELQAKATGDYLQLPRLHLPVMVDGNRKYRALELEVWIQPKDEQNLALARSAKKAIMAGLKDDFSNYDWEAFQDSQKGPDIAKRIVATGVERVSGAKISDVLIKTLVIH